jgi:hypothetical protein
LTYRIAVVIASTMCLCTLAAACLPPVAVPVSLPLEITLDRGLEPSGTVVVTIQDVENKRPVRTVTLDKSGINRIAELPPGDYWVGATANNLKTSIRRISVGGSGEKEKKVGSVALFWPSLQRASAKAASGVLLVGTTSGYKPLAAAALKWAELRTQKEISTTLTDSQGRFQLPTMEGDFLVHVEMLQTFTSSKPSFDFVALISKNAKDSGLHLIVSDTCNGWMIKPDYSSNAQTH